MVTSKNMACAEVVAALSSISEEWTPAIGETVELITFYPSGGFDAALSVTLYWDYMGANTILWTSHSTEPFNGDLLSVNTFIGNDVKKMALVLTNGSLQPVRLAAAALFRVSTT